MLYQQAQAANIVEQSQFCEIWGNQTPSNLNPP